MGYSASSSSGASQSGDSGFGNQGINFGTQGIPSAGINTNTLLIGVGLLLLAKALKII